MLQITFYELPEKSCCVKTSIVKCCQMQHPDATGRYHITFLT